MTKRRSSGGTMSLNGRMARDVMIGLLKTCRKLGIPFLPERIAARQSQRARRSVPAGTRRTTLN